MSNQPFSQEVMTYCEFSRRPLCVDTFHPRLSWLFENETGMQEGYRIRVANTQEALATPDELLWDSSWIASSINTGVPYEGQPLHSRQQYWWQAELRLEGIKNPILTQPDYWETAIISPEEWQGTWMAAPAHLYGVTDLFRKEFHLAASPVRGRLYVSGIGYYEAFLNGIKIGNRVLEPGLTDYRKRVLYSVYDITPQLQQGNNTLGIELAEGWYGHQHDSFDLFMGGQTAWNDTPRVILEADILLENGEYVVIASGGNTEFVTIAGAVVKNSIYDGETYDARREQPNWCCPNVKLEGCWKPAMQVPSPGGRLTAQQLPPIQVNQRLAPISMVQTDTDIVIDFGQNLAGWVAVQVNGQTGSSVTIRYGETLREDGTVNQDNLRGAVAKDRYILKGTGKELWHPRFTYHGFRYVQLQLDGGAQLILAEAQAVYTAVQQTGNFHCSESLLNRCFEAMIWTERSNMHSVPTDCPQRDERMAWLNDVTVRSEEAIYNFDLRLFYEKWLMDIADAQTDQGSIPDTAPHVYCGNPAFHVSSCFVLIPWFLYRYYGDSTILKKLYEPMKRYVHFLASQRGQDGIIGAPYFGDWAPPAAECDPHSPWSAEPVNIPTGLISTGYLTYDCQVLEKVALLLGKEEDAVVFRQLFAQTAEDINRKFYDAGQGYYQPGSQGANIFPLFLRIAPQPQQVFQHLLEDLQNHHGHITTGNQMTKYWFEVLSQFDRHDVALTMSCDDSYPSLGYMLQNGATTIWERWENLDGSGMNSHNHPMNGAYTVWYYKGIAGIEVDDQTGLTLTPGIWLDLESAQAEIFTPNGWLRSAFHKDESKIIVDITIPWNTHAMIRLKQPEYDFHLEENEKYTTLGYIKNHFICFSRPSGQYHFCMYKSTGQAQK